MHDVRHLTPHIDEKSLSRMTRPRDKRSLAFRQKQFIPMSTSSSDEMSSGAASRARELLAARDSESLLNLKLRAASPSASTTNNACAPKPPRRTTGHINARVETMSESSKRVEEILSSMKQKRETFTSSVHDVKSLVRKSEDRSHCQQPPTSGKPPLSIATGKDDLAKKMSESLKDKRNRITKLLSADHQKQRVSSRSPHTVDTATTEDSTTEDSLSIGSWAIDHPFPHCIVSESTKASVPLHEIEEAFENDDTSEGNEGICSDSSAENEGSNRTQSESLSNPFIPIDSDQSGLGHIRSTETPDEDRFGSNDESEPSSRSQGDKKVSFDDTPFVIEEMVPPSIVHCCSTSFETQFLKEDFLSRYTPDDSSYSAGTTETQHLRKTSSWDGSDLDTSAARKDRYSTLVKDREKRVILMRKLEQTYSELLDLHKEIESTKNQRIPSRDDSSDSSMEILENDDESSADFTNDSNTSGWVSRDESNSRLDSLLQYMTSEDDDSYEGSLTSQERFSISLSHTASNLDTLMESDETEEIDESMAFDKSISESENIRTETASHSPTDHNQRRSSNPSSSIQDDPNDRDVILCDYSIKLRKASRAPDTPNTERRCTVSGTKKNGLRPETAESTGVCSGSVRNVEGTKTTMGKDKKDVKLCASDARKDLVDTASYNFEKGKTDAGESFAGKREVRQLTEHEKGTIGNCSILQKDPDAIVDRDDSKLDKRPTSRLSLDRTNSQKEIVKNPIIVSEGLRSGDDRTTKKTIPKNPSIDSDDTRGNTRGSSTNGEKVTETIPKDPSTDSDERGGAKSRKSINGKMITKTIPKDPSIDSGETRGDRSRAITRGEKITKTIPEDPSVDFKDTRGDKSGGSMNSNRIKKMIPKDPSTDFDDTWGDRKTIPKDPSIDYQDTRGDKSRGSMDSNRITKMIPKDPSTDFDDMWLDRKTIPKDPSIDYQDTRGDKSGGSMNSNGITKMIPKDPSTDSDDMWGDRSTSTSTKIKKIVKKPSVDSKESKRSNQSKKKTKAAKKSSLKSKGDPRVINQVIVLHRRYPKGIVKREIDRWEAVQGNPKNIVEKPKKPDPPMVALSFEVSPSVEEMTEDEHGDTESNYFDEQERVRQDPEAEFGDVQENTEIVGTEHRPTEQSLQKMRRKYLFVPRKVSNKRCKASGGLLDLAKKTGISASSIICVKALDIHRPPELIAINAEFACGTQGSLYNLALRSGCEIEQTAEPQRLKLPPLGGGRRRWLLKARGGHYHISVWTTISNAVLTAKVGFSSHGNVKEVKRAKPEQRKDDCGARGLRHIAERTGCL